MAGQGRAQGGDAARLFDQPAAGASSLTSAVRLPARAVRVAGSARVDDGVGDTAADVGAAGDLDLMFDGGLDQDAQQVLVLQQRAVGR